MFRLWTTGAARRREWSLCWHPSIHLHSSATTKIAARRGGRDVSAQSDRDRFLLIHALLHPAISPPHPLRVTKPPDNVVCVSRARAFRVSLNHYSAKIEGFACAYISYCRIPISLLLGCTSRSCSSGGAGLAHAALACRCWPWFYRPDRCIFLTGSDS